jgi:hypothetical protein
MIRRQNVVLTHAGFKKVQNFKPEHVELLRVHLHHVYHTWLGKLITMICPKISNIIAFYSGTSQHVQGGAELCNPIG